MVECIIAGFLVLGGVFGLIGSYGLLRLPDPMQRLHAPTKAGTVGLWSVLIASALYSAFVEGRPSGHEVLIVLFLVVTAPITANFLAKVHMHQRTREADLPPTGTGRPWATFAPPSDAVDGAPKS
jgi:multicomponent K+:H+ antiporter subunit G